MEIKRIKGVVKDYAWGNKDFIPSLIGDYTGKPQAELWLGTHPSGDAVTEEGTPLSSLVYNEKGYLGCDWERYAGKLPLLMKILAIEKPLSLQCHPSKAQAKEGWAKEAEKRAKGEPCSYSDDNAKCEMFLALSPVTAMCGFRNLEVIKADLAAVVPSAYGRTIKALASSIKTLFMSLFALPAEEKKIILDELKASLSASSEASWDGLFLTRTGVARRCLEEHGDDIGCLFPYLLNVVHLRVGEALPIVPDTLHAYVFGNGVELMDASDNVLRGGLTPKRIDLPELERIMSFDEYDAVKCKTSEDGFGRRCYSSPSPDFRLLSAGTGLYEIKDDSIAIAIVTEGNVRFASKGETMTISKGEAVVIPAGLEYSMNVSGEIFISEVPDVE